jgi:CheY-like chemotaxis protein
MDFFGWVRDFFQRTGRQPDSQPGEAVDKVLVLAQAVRVEPELPRQEERRLHERVNARFGTRALIIDDSPTVIAVFRKILRSAGYEVLEALSAEEGIEIARSQHPELIFLDIVLPGMNGFAALRTMRKDPLIWQIPIIMISGNEQATEQFYADRIGADDFMKKPFSRHEVFARIERLLDADLRPKSKRALRLVTNHSDPQRVA